MTHKEKLIIGTLAAGILYAGSMFDGRVFYNPEEIILCKVGNYTFELMRKDCKDEVLTIEQIRSV